MAGEDPDYAIRDLFNHIEDGKEAAWTAYVQVSSRPRLRLQRGAGC